MFDKPIRLGITVALIFMCLSIVLLLRQSPLGQRSHTTLNVVCTTSIIADAVRIVGGEHVTIKCLMGPGVDPHIYRAREHDVHILAAADIIFYNGLHLEGKMGEILHNLNAYTTSIGLADYVPKTMLIESSEFEGVYDPHIWFDVPLWINVVKAIGSTLATVDPLHAQYYLANASAYCTQLEQLHTYVVQAVQSLPPSRRILVTAHDAFGYFGKAYGFNVIGLQGMSTESEASIKDIQTLVTYILTHNIPAIFVESSLPRRTIQVVQEAVLMHNRSLTVEPELCSDALGSPGTQAATYTGMIKHNINAIVSALSATAI